MSGFVSKQTDFGDKNHIFDKVFCQKLTDGNIELGLDELGGISQWESGKTYKVDSIVVYSDIIYKCKTENSDTTFNKDNWTSLLGSSGAPNWETNKDYKANSLVYINDKLYICIEEHTSGADFATDLLSGKWKFIGNGIGSNVSQTQLIGELPFTQTIQTATLSDLPTNYDYILITYLTNWGNRSVQVLSTDGDFYDIWQSFEVDYNTNKTQITHIQKFFTDKTMQYGVSAMNISGDVTSLHIHSIVGIKIQELTTSYIASLSMPSDIYETVTIPLSGNSALLSDYVPPANGYFVAISSSSSTSSFLRILVRDPNKKIILGSTAHYMGGNAFIVSAPCNKGQFVDVYGAYAATGLSGWFVYSVGAAKELGLID